MIHSSKKLGKENIFDGKTELNIIHSSAQNCVEEKPKKLKRKGLKVIKEGNGYPTKDIRENVDGVQQKEKAFKLTIHREEEAEKMNNVCNDTEPVVPLPTGTELVTIAGIDIPNKDAGNALQFMEFCATFGKVTFCCYAKFPYNYICIHLISITFFYRF